MKVEPEAASEDMNTNARDGRSCTEGHSDARLTPACQCSKGRLFRHSRPRRPFASSGHTHLEEFGPVWSNAGSPFRFHPKGERWGPCLSTTSYKMTGGSRWCEYAHTLEVSERGIEATPVWGLRHNPMSRMPFSCVAVCVGWPPMGVTPGNVRTQARY